MKQKNDLSLLKILKGLTLTQSWGTFVGICVVIGTVFTLGYQLAVYSKQLELNGLSSSLTVADKRIEKISHDKDVQTIKGKFLEHYLRYALVRRKGTEEDVDRAGNILVKFVYQMWKTQENTAVEVVMGSTTRTERRKERVSQPYVGKPVYEWREEEINEIAIKKITFPNGQVFTLPPEIAKAVHASGDD